MTLISPVSGIDQPFSAVLAELLNGERPVFILVADGKAMLPTEGDDFEEEGINCLAFNPAALFGLPAQHGEILA